ncbi:hypothetical protein QFZ23_002331 [Arthrobacter globiformis]|nr:hypothetical protein [Arthrobacter globiformis]
MRCFRPARRAHPGDAGRNRTSARPVCVCGTTPCSGNSLNSVSTTKPSSPSNVPWTSATTVTSSPSSICHRSFALSCCSSSRNGTGIHTGSCLPRCAGSSALPWTPAPAPSTDCWTPNRPGHAPTPASSAFLRHAGLLTARWRYRHSGLDMRSEDVWDAAVIGLREDRTTHTMCSKGTLDFRPITVDWLRQAAQDYSRQFDLAADQVRDVIRTVQVPSDALARRPHGPRPEQLTRADTNAVVDGYRHLTGPDGEPRTDSVKYDYFKLFQRILRDGGDLETLTWVRAMGCETCQVGLGEGFGCLQEDPYPAGSSAVKNRIRQERHDRLGTQRHESLGGPKPALIRRRALSAWSRTWSGPHRRETSGSPPGSGSPSCPGL